MINDWETVKDIGEAYEELLRYSKRQDELIGQLLALAEGRELSPELIEHDVIAEEVLARAREVVGE